MQHQSFPSCCTASVITGWSAYIAKSAPPLDKIVRKQQLVRDLVNGGSKLDFALICVITTENQIGEGPNKLADQEYLSLELLKQLGFERVFDGAKPGASQRHKETGAVVMWCVTPAVYNKRLTEYAAELEVQRKVEAVERPRPRPEIETLVPQDLKVNGVRARGQLDDLIVNTLLVTPSVFLTHVKLKYKLDLTTVAGWDINTWTWRMLKATHAEYKAGRI